MKLNLILRSIQQFLSLDHLFIKEAAERKNHKASFTFIITIAARAEIGSV